MSREERDARFHRNLTKIVDSVASWYTIDQKELADRKMAMIMHDLVRNHCIYSFRIVDINQAFSRIYVQRNKSVMVDQIDYGWI